MTRKILAFLFFLLVVTFVVIISYHNSLDTTMEINNYDNSQADILEMTPSETFKLTLKNTLPEIKALSFLLFLVFIAAIMGARFEIVSDITRDVAHKAFESMIAKRDEKLATIAEKKLVKNSLVINDKSAINTVIDQLEKSIAAKNSRHP